MAVKFQPVPLVDSISYPNAVAWSEENLIAVASGHLVTIINPALPSGPRGSITIVSPSPYEIGRIKKEDLLCSTMLPIALSRDRRPCVRSVAWSFVGMASNYGCLLAVCTTEGSVKLYRPPYRDFCAEWIEVVDVSDLLYKHYMSTSFGEKSSDNIVEGQDCTNAMALVPSIERKRKPVNVTFNGCTLKMLPDSEHNADFEVDSLQETEVEVKKQSKKSGAKPRTSRREKADNSTDPKITSEQYNFRSNLLTSLVVAWSPLLLSHEKLSTCHGEIASKFSLLAVGGKSGNILFWKINAPPSYSAEYSVTPSITLAQCVQAHSSWVTTICFSVVNSGASSNVILASGSSDGSVKFWVWKKSDNFGSCETSICFTLLEEVFPVNCIPISVISLSLPCKSSENIFVAAGKCAGILDVWRLNLSTSILDKIDSCQAHDYVITGLAWESDCLFSSSQDNYIRCWNLRNDSLCEAPFPHNVPDMKSSLDPADVFLSCHGLAISPGNLILVTARNFDVEQLNPMYQASAQRAAIEFFWLGAHQSHQNIVQFLTEFENPERHLVLWDITLGLSSFDQSSPGSVDNLLISWLSGIIFPDHEILPVDDFFIRNISSRKLHIFNVLCRRVILSDFHSENQIAKWIKLLACSEKELRERMVFINLSLFLHHSAKSSASDWSGISQMQQWVISNSDEVRIQVKKLAEEVGRLHLDMYNNDQCSYCSAPVPFTSPELAHCCINGHKLRRCSVSMQVCPTSAVWICKCCDRSASVLPPPSFFSMPSFLDLIQPSQQLPKPLCPFCGILLQVWQPDFLPSVTPA